MIEQATFYTSTVVPEDLSKSIARLRMLNGSLQLYLFGSFEVWLKVYAMYL